MAVDLHPEYLSSKFAKDYAAQHDLPIIEVQHHHAHIAACLIDNSVPLTAPPVLGIALDGLGFGSDGTLWGGEFLLADYRRFERLAYFKPTPMPGVGQAIREPWRMVLAYLNDNFGWTQLVDLYAELAFFRYVKSKPVATLRTMIAKDIRCPPTSSCGRIFDAAASLLGLCHSVSFESQAAMALEANATTQALRVQEDTQYVATLRQNKPIIEIETKSLWQALLDDIRQGLETGVIAARFHHNIATIIVTVVQKLTEQTDNIWQNRIALSGGVFQNAILLEQVITRLQTVGYTVYSHSQIPTNDGGLALGQAVIAAALNSRGEACA